MIHYERINDFTLPQEDRLDALMAYLQSGGRDRLIPQTSEINNHIHTMYSFSPYTPAMAALKARESGLQTAGSVDHDSLMAADEMQKACKLTGLGCVTGFELRVSFKHTDFAGIKINNPDSLGIAYITIQGIPAQSRPLVNLFLQPIQRARHKRNRAMIESLNKLLLTAGIKMLSYDEDIYPLSKANSGGSITERHILYALVKLFVKTFGKGERLIAALQKTLKLDVPAKIKNLLTANDNPHYEYDLLGVLRISFLPRFFIQPDEAECLSAETATAFAQALGGIPAYSYLGDITESPTGDKKPEKFEDSYLDALFPLLKKLGFQAITYMPPRNTSEQLLRIQKLCALYDFMEISGVDINSSRQSFNCSEIAQPEFAHLIKTTWALSVHEALTSFDGRYALFSPQNPLKHLSLQRRIQLYADLGKQLNPIGQVSVQEAINILINEVKK